MVSKKNKRKNKRSPSVLSDGGITSPATAAPAAGVNKAAEVGASNAKIPACAACGKKDGDLMTCGCSHCVKLKGMVYPTVYCNNRCQKSHQEKHQQEQSLIGGMMSMFLDAKKREWEGKDSCRLYDGDEDLFKDPPPRDECEICCLTLPIDESQWFHQACCGKAICHGCIHQVNVNDKKNVCPCPFCRAPACDTTEFREMVERLKKRMEAGDGYAFRLLGNAYEKGWYGLKKDMKKALELWTEGAELGSASGHLALGSAYFRGSGVKQDDDKAKYHLGIAAMGGDVHARCMLGRIESDHAFPAATKEAGIYNKAGVDRAVAHWMIAAKAGSDKSLGMLKTYYSAGLKDSVSKKDFEVALRAHKDATDAMKSEERKIALEWAPLQKMGWEACGGGGGKGKGPMVAIKPGSFRPFAYKK